MPKHPTITYVTTPTRSSLVGLTHHVIFWLGVLCLTKVVCSTVLMHDVLAERTANPTEETQHLADTTDFPPLNPLTPERY